MTMSNTQLKWLLVADAIIIAMYAIGTGLDPDGSVSLAVAVVAAMVLQTITVLGKRPRTPHPQAQPDGESPPTDH